MRPLFLLLVGMLIGLSAPGQQVKPHKSSLVQWRTGVKTTLDALAQGKPAVVITLGTECPICQKYAGQLHELVAAYPQVGFVGVFTKWEDTTLIQPFIDSYGLNFPMATDPGHRFMKQLKTDVTPEVFLITPEGVIVYRGGINDWFVGLGKYRTVVTEAYLKNALDAYLAGLPIQKPKTKAIGCVFTL